MPLVEKHRDGAAEDVEEEDAALVGDARRKEQLGGGVGRRRVLLREGEQGARVDPRDGHLDPSGTTHAYAKAARLQGAEIVLRNPVLELNPQPDRSWEVVTDLGSRQVRSQPRSILPVFHPANILSKSPAM